MRIIFWGTPEYAAKNLKSLIEKGHEIVAVVTQPDRKRGRGKRLTYSPVKEMANEYGIPTYTPENIKTDNQIRNQLFGYKADIFIVVAFGQILTKDLLEHPKLGCWNSHASILPRWRGAAPIQWSILSGDKIAGVSIMSMEEGLDTGPVVIKETIDIDPDINYMELSEKLCLLSSLLLDKLITKIQAQKDINYDNRLTLLKAISQDSLGTLPKYARIIKKEDHIIDWKETSITIQRKILALFPNCYTFYKEKRIKVSKIQIINNNDLILELKESIDLSIYKPGQIINSRKAKEIYVKTADSLIKVVEAKIEGKNYCNSSQLYNSLLIENTSSFNCDFI